MPKKFKLKHTHKSRLRFQASRLRPTASFLLVVILASSIYPLAQSLVVRAAPYVYEQIGQIGNPVDMDEPEEFAVDTDNNYYTASVNYDYYIRKFSPAGVELMRFGSTEWSSAVGELGWVGGIAIKSNGEIYVSDGDNKRINVYNTAGQFVREITTFDAGLTFIYNEEIHFAPNGNLYVLDSGGTIRIFDTNDTYLSSFSAPGTADGQFSNANDFAVDMNGDVYVGDYNNNRVQVFDSSWNYLRKFSTGAMNRPLSIALTQDAHLMLVDDNHGIKKYTTAGIYVGNISVNDNPLVGGNGTANGETAMINDLLVLSNGNVSSLEAYPSRIQTFSGTGTYLSQFGNAGSEPGQFGYGLVDVATDPTGNVYVADIFNKRVQKFTADGAFVMEFGDQTVFGGTPRAVAVSPLNGNIYVFESYSSNSRIKVFNSSGAQIGTLGSFGSGVGQYNNSRVSMAINNAGEIFIGNTHGVDAKIMVYDASGAFQREWATLRKDTAINYASSIELDNAGNVYLATSSSSYIIKYSPTGDILATYGRRAAAAPDTPDGYLSGAIDIEIAPNGMMYVAEPSNSTISVFDSDGTFLRRFGSKGYKQNQFMYPQSIEIGPSGKLYVADDYNNRISIYDIRLGIDAASSPRDLVVAYTGPGSANVSWSTPATDGGDPIKSYLVEYSMPNAHPQWEAYAQVPATQTNLTMEGLPAGDYLVRVRASNRGGLSAAAQTAQALRIHAAFKLERVISPNAPNQDIISSIGVYSDGTATLLSRRFSSRIQTDTNGNEVTRLGSYGTGDGQAQYIDSADVDKDDNLFVADLQNRRITKYDKDGAFIAHYTTGVRYPVDLNLDETSSHYYAITSSSLAANGRVDKYNTNGTFVATVAPALTTANAVTVAADGSIYVAHSTGTLRQVVKFAPDGITQLATYGQNGASPDGLISPSGVGVLSTGEVLVTDSASNTLKAFSADGTVLGKVGNGNGTRFHQFNVARRIQVVNDLIYVADQGNGIIKVYSLYNMPTSTAPSSPQNLTADTSVANSLALNWNRPLTDGNDPIAQFVVEYKLTADTEWVSISLAADRLAYTIENLAAGTYDVRVFARNNYGDSPVAQLVGNSVSNPTSTSTPDSSSPPSIPDTLQSTGMNAELFLAVSGTLIGLGAYLIAKRQQALSRHP